MKYLTFRDREISVNAFKNEDGMMNAPRQILEVYVFNDPKLESYETGFIGVNPTSKGYSHWLIEDGVVEKADNGILLGMGVLEEKLFKVNETFDKNIFAKKLGISIEIIEKILN